MRTTFPCLKEYSLSGVWRVLRRHGLQLRAAQLRQHSPDPEDVAQLEHLLACLREAVAHPNEVVLLCLDEMDYYRWPAAGRTWAPAAPQPAPLADRAGPSNKQWRVIGALNALSGRVDYLDAYIIGREKVIQFYRQVVAAYPHARRI